MPRITLAQLHRITRPEDLAPAYYIHGAESLLKREAVEYILDQALEPGTRDFNLDMFSAGQLDPAELPVACATVPMMAPRRTVVVRDVEAWKRKSKGKQPVVDYLTHAVPETVLILVQTSDDDPDRDLAQHATTLNCEPLTGQALDRWLDARLKQSDLQLEPEAREHLLRATGSELGAVAIELEKLSALERDPAKPVDRETLSALVGVRFGETPDDWRDAVLRDNTAQALALLPPLLGTTGISGVKLVTELGSSLLVLQWARTVAEREKVRDSALASRVSRDVLLSTRPGVGSYQTFSRLIAEVVGRWPVARIRTAVAATLRADIMLKQTTISDPTGILTDLVLALAPPAARQAA